MADNLLKLNDDKTEVIVITSRAKISEELGVKINVGGHYISPSVEPPRNPGPVLSIYLLGTRFGSR